MKKKWAICLAALILPVGVSTKAEAHVTKNCSQYHRLLRKYGMPAETFGRIMYRESRCKPGAKNLYKNKNGSSDWGLLQINWQAHRSWLRKYGITSPYQLLNAETNIRMASKLYKRAGTRPWKATR